MARVIEKEVVERDGTGSSAVWALAVVLVVGMIVGALYYSGALSKLSRPAQDKINVEVKTP